MAFQKYKVFHMKKLGLNVANNHFNKTFVRPVQTVNSRFERDETGFLK